MATVEKENSRESKPLAPGDVVLTSFGVAVVTRLSTHWDLESENEETRDDKARFFQGRIWRIAGRSIASSATAYLRFDTIIKRLPVAPGMITTVSAMKSPSEDATSNIEKATPTARVLVHCYSAQTDNYLVSDVSNELSQLASLEQIRKPFISHADDDLDLGTVQTKQLTVHENQFHLFTLQASDLSPAKCAKFYPLIQDLMQKGDQAAASATTIFRANPKLMSFAAKSSASFAESANNLSSQFPFTDVGSVSSSLQDAVPDKTEIKQIYKMLKDDELTVLLQKGQERLRQLVSNDIPKATELALRSTGIEIENDLFSSSSAMTTTVSKSRVQALTALDKILAENLDTNFDTLQRSLGDQFTIMFDTLATAAKSDHSLNFIFEKISGKTSEWQEQTGRLLESRSVSLFFEGTQRLQARAAGMFSPQQMAWAQESGVRLTKAFTEGDAALARLKTIELGDAVRTRLVSAIELRSDSQGGLDGIIAGALSKFNNGGNAADGNVQTILAQLQKSATNATKGAHETLVALLSQKSQYRDIVILRIEQVMVELEAQLGEDLSAVQIAKLASGEGGTAAIFEPVARKAAKEIEKQLDVAEASVEDPTMLTLLSHVRKIVSGDLSITGLVDEVTKILNDDSVVAAGENFVKEGERILDVLENVSGNKAVEDMLSVAEKAGLTKDAMMKHMNKLNIENILDTAEGAVTDENKRKELLSSATDSALDFLLQILPSMPVPPFDGVKDGLIYHISNLSMKGFKVKKEDVIVEIAGIRAVAHSEKDKSITNRVDSPNDIDLVMGKMESSVPLSSTQLEIDASQEAASLVNEEVEINSNYVKPTELLIIDVRNISALLEKAIWSFEQTYLPYWKSSGNANVTMSEGHIRLQFELRKMPVLKKSATSGETLQWEPVLCLHKRSCTIGDVKVQLEGDSKLTWILNKLGYIFKGALRDYVVRSILTALTDKSGWLLEKLNGMLATYWDLVLKTAGLTKEDLIEASEDDIIAATPDPHANEVDLVWRDRVPLGINLLLNDDSGRVRVVDFPRGSQARKAATEKFLDPEHFRGATIVAVNGTRFDCDEQDDLFEALRDPCRPKTVRFDLADSDAAEKVREFARIEDNNQEQKQNGNSDSCLSHTEKAVSVNYINIVDDCAVGIKFSKSVDDYALVVSSFLKSDSGQVLAAEKSGNVFKGHILSHVNDNLVLGENGAGAERAFSTLESVGANRPLVLGFVKPYLELVTFVKPVETIADTGVPEEFVFAECKLPSGRTRIILKGFKDVDGQAELGNVFIGDRLFFINGLPVGGGCSLLGIEPSPDVNGLMTMLKNEKAYPMALTFARQSKRTSRWTTSSTFDVHSADTFCVTVSSFEQLGCTIGPGDQWDDFIVKKFHAVKGSFQKKLQAQIKHQNCIGLAIESVNGQVVPSYASCDMVANAMKRSWTRDGRLEVLFCNDNTRHLVRGIANKPPDLVS